MSKISELSDGGSLQSTDYLIAVRSGGNVKVQADGNLSLGALTLTGLTVGGNADVNGSLDVGTSTSGVLNLVRPSTNYIRANETNGAIAMGVRDAIRLFTGQGAGEFLTNERLRIASNGDISFYEDTGTTPKFFWDASAESLGIGTTSPDGIFEAAGGRSYVRGSDENFTFGVGRGGQTSNYFLGATASASPDLLFSNNSGTTNVVFTHGGNVGIGTTSPSSKLQIDGSGSTTSEQLLSIVNPGGNTGAGARLWLSGTNSTTRGTYIEGQARSTGNNHDLIFATSATSASPTERMRIDFNGNVGIGTTSPRSLINVTGDGADGGILTLENNSGSLIADRNVGQIHFYANDGSTNGTGAKAKIQALATNSLGNEVGLTFSTSDSSSATGTERMRIDSSGNVGIGTSSPSAKLTLNDSGQQVGIDFKEAGTTRAHIEYDGTIPALELGTNSASNVVLKTYNTERARIDSNGVLYAGKSTQDISVVGHELHPQGFVFHTRDNAEVLYLRRNSSDGRIQNFYKDGTLVGGIGVQDADNLYVSGSVANHAGVKFGTNTVTPMVADSNADNSVDLGTSSVRWQDLYLSGGVYLGGTGAANLLDDYEEGTWTPTLGGTWTTNPTSLSGTYTKIGRLVHIQVKMTGGVKLTAISGYLEGVPISIVTEGTGSVSDSSVADHGNCLFANTDRIWFTDTNLGTGTVYISGCYLTT